MMTAALWCRTCHAPLEPGTALAVTIRATGETFHVHRSGGDHSACLLAAGSAVRSSIALEDLDAARAFDAAHPRRPREIAA